MNFYSFCVKSAVFSVFAAFKTVRKSGNSLSVVRRTRWKSGNFFPAVQEIRWKSGNYSLAVRKGLVLLPLVSCFSFYSLGEERVLDLGEIEITGEVRRPDINLIYSKKYIKRAAGVIAGEEFKKLEEDLLKPAGRSNSAAVTRKRGDIKPTGKTNQRVSEGKTKHLKPNKQVKKFPSGKEGAAEEKRRKPDK